MKLDRVMEILEALASGCSPQTGEMIKDDSVLNERDVIRALEKAISELDKISDSSNSSIKISHFQKIKISLQEVDYVIKLFQSVDYSPSYSLLTHFFLKSKYFDIPVLDSDKLYGKYFGYYSKQELNSFFRDYLTNNGLTVRGKKRKEKEPEPWRDIDFFRKEKFNRLSDKAIRQLKSRINEIGVLKTENLSEYIINSRVKYARAYETWTEKEKQLLKTALEYTNDLELLSDCFQRGRGSIESCGKKLIYENLT
jgi:hypothetical protein